MDKSIYLFITLFMIFCYVGYFSQFTIMSQYIYHRFASEIKVDIKNFSKCDMNKNKTINDAYNTVQKEAANFNIYAQLSSGIPSIISILLIGIFSDIYGRKNVILISWICLTLSGVVNVLLVAFNLPLWTYLVGQFIAGLGGSYGAIISVVLSLISDYTLKSQRNLGVIVIEFTLGLSMILSQLILGVWLKSRMFYWPTLTFAFLQTLSIVFVFFIKEKKEYVRTNLRDRSFILDLMKLVEIFQVRRGLINPVNWLLLICLTCFFIHTFNFIGNMTIMTVYFFGAPFCWQSDNLGYYRSLSHTIVLMGVFLSMPMLLKLRINQLTIVQIGFGTSFVSKLLLAVAPIYSKNIATNIAFGSLMDLFSGACVSLLRSMSSKLVSQDHYGTLFGFMSCLETIGGLLGGIGYNGVYNMTLEHFYGAVYGFAAGLILVAFVIMMFYYLIEKRQDTNNYEQLIESTEIHS